MHLLRFPLLALLSGTALAKIGQEVTTLKPVSGGKGQRTRPDQQVTPSKKVGLDYGVDLDPLVHVELDMQKPAVLLEGVASIEQVTCANETISISFSSEEGFTTAVENWSNKGDLVFFTNHLGGCDSEFERGVFLVRKVSGKAESLTIVAQAEKKDVASTATNTAITFEGVPVAKKRQSVSRKGLNERGITLDEKGLTIGGTVGLPRFTPIYSFPPYLDVSADSAEITASVTFSGFLDYDVFAGKLKQLYVDIDSSIDAEVGVTIAVTAGYRDSFMYNPGLLSYMIVDVPGILKLGPELLFGIGLDVDVEAGVTVTGTAGAGLKNGIVHLDFLDTSKTSLTPWKPVYNAKLELSERARAKADAWIDVTFQLIVEVLGGVVDLSAGITARPRFNNEFAFTASQTVEAPDSVDFPNDLVCAQGLSLKSDFTFSLYAFVTTLWSNTIYNIHVPIAEECYTWLK